MPWQRNTSGIGLDGRRWLLDVYTPDPKGRNQTKLRQYVRPLADGEVWPPRPKVHAPPPEQPPRSTDPSELLKLDRLRPSEVRIIADSAADWVKRGGYDGTKK